MRNKPEYIIIFQKIKDYIFNLKFKSLNLNFSKQLVLLWSILWIISLFMSWVINNDKWHSWNSFNSISWNIWYILIIIILIVVFTILSINYKEKIELYSNISIKNYTIVIFSWILIIIFGIISLSFINWFDIFFKNITYWNWVILSMTAWIIILIWWFIIRKEYKSNNVAVILDEMSKVRNEKKQAEKDNMKLPF